MSLIHNATFDSQTRVLSLLDKAGNVISSCEVPSKDVDDITKPLTLKAIQDGSTVALTRSGSPVGDFQTSRDGGKTWKDYFIGTDMTLNTGDEVSFRAKADRTPSMDGGIYFYFKMTGKIEAWHNVMSMIRTNNFATYDTAISFAFNNLFSNCESLTKAPVLPATTLANDCYTSMFRGCQSLTKAPELPATTLAHGCYWIMFYNCQSLKEVRISATTTATDALFNWLYNVSATGDFYCDPNATIFPTDSPSGIPKGWTRVPAVDDITKPLTFKATQDGSTVKLTKSGSPVGGFQTSTDGGNTWTDYTINTAIALNTGDKVSFRAKADRSEAQSYENYFGFQMTGKIEAWHNVMSMLRPQNFNTSDPMIGYAFSYMFMGCTSLTKTPVLPATTLARYCYRSMFMGCTSLTKTPVLPATTLAEGCYTDMFNGCTSLTEAPVLPVTTLENFCYNGMFNGCTSLTEAPELPATTLAKSCYNGMFMGCTSLTKTPVLPATTLADYCYFRMFNGCSSLNEVHCQMPSSISAEDIPTYTGDGSNIHRVPWLNGVSSTGTFYTNADANWPSGASGIPTGWNRVNA